MKRDYSSHEKVRIFPENWLNLLPLERWFDMRRPLEIDLGFGKGRFLLARAEHYPDVNFLGIERMLDRVRRVGKKAVTRGLDNLRILRIEGLYAARYLIPDGVVDTWYVFFPDPWPKKRHLGNRLFDEHCRDALCRTMKPGAAVHAATDHLPYFDDMYALLKSDRRFEEIEPFVPDESEQTDFERLYLGKKRIGRCSFRRR